jgi:hypothetical protein
MLWYFFDDIVVYRSTLEQHVDHLQSVLALLRRDKWQVKMSKCSFGQNSLAYLGHIISGNGVTTDPSKIKEISNWQTHSCVKALRNFLGLVGYYRKFICHFGLIAKPLTELLKKNTIYTWSPDADTAFNLLKQTLVSAPVLAIPDFSLAFVVDTDASD